MSMEDQHNQQKERLSGIMNGNNSVQTGNLEGRGGGENASLSSASTFSFNDARTADVLLVLRKDLSSSSTLEGTPNPTAEPETLTESETPVYLHSQALMRCKYFAVALSDRWQQGGNREGEKTMATLELGVPGSRGTLPYLAVLRLTYSPDLLGAIPDTATAIACLPIAAELLFDDCISACTHFLEAVPWTQEEERQIVLLVPCLQIKESNTLLNRLLPSTAPTKQTAVEEMLNRLVYVATHSHPNGATVKGFVATLLGRYASRDTVRAVLDNAFASNLKMVKDSVEEYSSPNVRGRYDEIEALQRMNLHSASVNGKHLLWLLERMIELKVADNAVAEWSEQVAFTANLQRVVKDDALRSIAPGLPVLLLRCTGCLANAMVTGSIIASRQVRMKLVKYWLPVLIATKDNFANNASGVKLLLEIEDLFMRIISTLPFEDAQDLLPECLSFATRNVEDCMHLVSAFDTWFRRASSIQIPDDGKETCGFE